MPSPAALNIEPLGSHHDRSTFSCGNVDLDLYLKEKASQDQKRKLTACHVAVRPESPQVLGYYTLSSYSIGLGELPAAVTRRLPKYPTVPAALIGRLAVDQTVQGQGVGERLLIDALVRTADLQEEIGIYAVIVDAKSETIVPFYTQFGFQAFPSEPLRLFIPIATIIQALPDR